MRRMMKATIAGLCASATLVSAVVIPQAIDQKRGTASSGPEMWSTYSGYYVLQDPASMEGRQRVSPTVLAGDADLYGSKDGESGAGLSIRMFRGETESAQLIFTPKQNVSSYSVTVSDLVSTDGQSVIESNYDDPTWFAISPTRTDTYKWDDKVNIWTQYYIQNVANFKYAYEYVAEGMYPDLLVPMERTVYFNENKITAGKNQGVFIDVTADQQQAPGIYKGVVTVTMNGVETKMPLTVQVDDIVVERSYMVSAGASGMTLSPDAYEMCLSYHILPQCPPGGAAHSDLFVEQIRKYWNNPNFSHFEIPNQAYDTQGFRQHIYALAVASIEDNINYFERCMTYMQAVDEPQDGAYAAQVVAKYIDEMVGVCDLLGLGSEQNDFDLSLEDSQMWRDRVMSIPLAISNDLWVRTIRAEDFQTDKYPEGSMTYILCHNGPGSNEEILKEFKASAEKGGHKVYAYSNGYFPNTAHSLPNYADGMKGLGWECAKNGLGGYLFWDMDNIMQWPEYTLRDYYTQLNGGHGDSQQIYPASRWAIEKQDDDDWYPSGRIRAYRDGVDDYNLIYEFEKMYNDGLLAGYGVDKEVSEILSFIYNRGLSSQPCVYNPNDGHTFQEMREAIMDLFLLAKSDLKFATSGVTIDKTTATINFFMDNAGVTSVTANGQTLSGNGAYSYSWNINENPYIAITVVKNGKTYTFETMAFEQGMIKNALETKTASQVKEQMKGSPFAGISILDHLRNDIIKEGSVSYDNTNDIVTLEIKASKGYDMSENLNYSPEFVITKEFFGVSDAMDVCYISMTVEVQFNGESLLDGKELSGIPMMFCYRKGSADTEFDVFMFDDDCVVDKAQRIYRRTLRIIVDRQNIDDVDSFAFKFRSYHTDFVLDCGATVTLSNIYYTLR